MLDHQEGLALLLPVVTCSHPHHILRLHEFKFFSQLFSVEIESPANTPWKEEEQGGREENIFPDMCNIPLNHSRMQNNIARTLVGSVNLDEWGLRRRRSKVLVIANFM